MKKRFLVLDTALALTSLAFAFQDKAQNVLLACFGCDSCPVDQSCVTCCDPVSGQPLAKK